MSDPSHVKFHLSPDDNPTPAAASPSVEQQHDDAAVAPSSDKPSDGQEHTAAASAAPAVVAAGPTANGSSSAAPAPAAAAPVAAATAEGEAPAAEHQDLDYENTGQGFVSRATLVRKGSMSVKRGPSFNLTEGLAAAPPTNVAGAPAAIELTERKGLLAGAAAEERKQPEGTKDSAVIDMKGADGEVPADALWMLTLPQLASKFPDSAIDPANPRGSRGLTSQRAAELLAKNGRNELKPPAEHSEFVKYLLQFTDPFMLLLIVAGILSACVAYPVDTSQSLNLYLGIILWLVVLISATFSYVQEGKASDVMKSFKGMLPAQARVVRDGAEVSVPAAELVVGDLLKVGTGDIIPADMRVVWTQDCKVETSSLTGESLPVSTSLFSPDTPKIEQAKNVCFNSSKCLEGESWGVVFATGDASLIGQIAGLAGATKKEDTTLQKEIKLFVKSLTLFALILGIIFFIISMARGNNWISAFINAFIVVMIACCPEGLPMTVVSCLTITAKRLGEKNVFVKQLQSVETLGSITVIATDKTGTLTQNKMTVANMWFDGSSNTADSVFQHYPPHRVQRKAPAGSSSGDYHMGATLEQLELIAVICSKTRFEDERVLTPDQARQMEQVETLKSMDPSMTMRRAKVQYPTLYGGMDPGLSLNSGRSKMFANLVDVMRDDSTRNVVGDASETALFNFVRQRQSIELLRFHHPKVYDIPFNSRNKYAITITKPVGLAHVSSEKRTLLMKGAPEVILARCTHFLRRGEIHPIDERFKSEFTDAYERFGSMGQRVLGFAMLDLPEDKFGSKFDDKYAEHSDAVPTSGLVFTGLISLVDPPKESVPQAVLDCHSAGIKVIMVTGDHPLTAAAIARQVNIFLPGHFTRAELAQLKGVAPEQVDEDEIDAVVVTGPEIDHFTEADWARVLSKDDIVFARTTPQQKLTIVEHLQAMGHVVAATGDGVNDSPALKKADIGVAMGINGSDVARDAAAVILMDDNFASIVVGVREGRTIFDNLTKTIAYTITHTLPEVFPLLLTLTIGLPPAISSIFILTIDLFTELPPAVSVAYEPSEANVMSRPPRNAKTDRLVTWQVMFYCLLQAGVIETGAGLLGFFLVFRYYGIPASMLFDAKHFIGKADSDDMTPFPGCNPDPSNGPLSVGSVCFDVDAQNLVLREAQTCYYAILTFAQVFHIWLCKTRFLSIFTHGLMRNEFTLWGVTIEICLIILVIFPPSSNDIFGSRPFPPRFWALIVIAPAALFLWQEGRKWWVRRHPNGFIAKRVNW